MIRPPDNALSAIHAGSRYPVMSAKKDSLIEIKGAMLPVLTVILRSLDRQQLADEARQMFGDAAFFDGDLAALDFSAIEGHEHQYPLPDWAALRQLFSAYGLQVIGTRGGSEELAASAAQAGLPPLSIAETSSRPHPQPSAPQAKPEPQPAAKPEPAPAAARAQANVSNTVIIDRPLRSGQQVYARGGDVIVLAVVSTGAEVIADGSIHVYAPLRGRALAGASGDTRARILTTRMEAELVSIAGLYRTFENGVPPELLGKPAQIRLAAEEQGKQARLLVEPLSIG